MSYLSPNAWLYIYARALPPPRPPADLPASFHDHAAPPVNLAKHDFLARFCKNLIYNVLQTLLK